MTIVKFEGNRKALIFFCNLYFVEDCCCCWWIARVHVCTCVRICACVRVVVCACACVRASCATITTALLVNLWATHRIVSWESLCALSTCHQGRSVRGGQRWWVCQQDPSCSVCKPACPRHRGRTCRERESEKARENRKLEKRGWNRRTCGRRDVVQAWKEGKKERN